MTTEVTGSRRCKQWVVISYKKTVFFISLFDLLTKAKDVRAPVLTFDSKLRRSASAASVASDDKCSRNICEGGVVISRKDENISERGTRGSRSKVFQVFVAPAANMTGGLNSVQLYRPHKRFTHSCYVDENFHLDRRGSGRFYAEPLQESLDHSSIILREQRYVVTWLISQVFRTLQLNQNCLASRCSGLEVASRR